MLGEPNPVTQFFIDLTRREKTVLYPVVVLIILIGVYPAPLLSWSEPVVNNLLRIASDFTASLK